MIKSVLANLSRLFRELGFRIEAVLGALFNLFAKLRPSNSAAHYLESKVGRVTGALGDGVSGPSRVGVRIEAVLASLVGFVRRWRLTYVFVLIFGAAMAYQVYLLSLAEAGSARTALLASMRLTIYAAILFFSLAMFINSPIQPWLAVWRGWAGALKRIRLTPLAFAACFLVYFGARLVGYIPASYLAGREAITIVLNFLLGMTFSIVLAFVTRALYWRTIAMEPAPNGQSPRLIATSIGLWFLAAVVTSLLSVVMQAVRPNWIPFAVQFVWLAQMGWSALTLFLIPAVVVGRPKPLITGLRSSVAFLWILIVCLVLVNLPADIFSVLSTVATTRLPQSLASRLAIDFVMACVNAIVFFASQVATLLLFVAACRVVEPTIETRSVPA